MAIKPPVAFTISVVGENTGEKWFGKFTCKVRSTHRDEFVQDQRRRELLGGSPQYASPRAMTKAEVFSLLDVAIVDAPKWWRECDNGLDLEDENIIAEVFEKVIEIRKNADEEMTKQAEEAKKELAKTEISDEEPS